MLADPLANSVRFLLIEGRSQSLDIAFNLPNSLIIVSPTISRRLVASALVMPFVQSTSNLPSMWLLVENTVVNM
jgi:hypothetical protein